MNQSKYLDLFSGVSEPLRSKNKTVFKMNDAVLIQHVYPGAGFEPMLELTKAHHAAYCEQHGFDYWCEVYEMPGYPMASGAWVKVDLLRKAINAGYKYIVWLDADAFIVDLKADLREAIAENKIGVCWHRIPQLNHWNTGVMYVYGSPTTQNFIERWFEAYPPPNDGWFEQGVFNHMAKRDATVVTLSDKWNATIDVSMVPDAVVLGFHGQDNRYKKMKAIFERKFPKQEAATAQGMSEVHNDS